MTAESNIPGRRTLLIVGVLQVVLWLPMAWFFLAYRAYDPPALAAVAVATSMSATLAAAEIVLIVHTIRRTRIIPSVLFTVLLAEIAVVVCLTVSKGWQIRSGA